MRSVATAGVGVGRFGQAVSIGFENIELSEVDDEHDVDL